MVTKMAIFFEIQYNSMKDRQKVPNKNMKYMLGELQTHILVAIEFWTMLPVCEIIKNRDSCTLLASIPLYALIFRRAQAPMTNSFVIEFTSAVLRGGYINILPSALTFLAHLSQSLVSTRTIRPTS
jgi:hypothetical protein